MERTARSLATRAARWGAFGAAGLMMASCSVFDSSDPDEATNSFAEVGAVEVVDVLDGDTFVVDIDGDSAQVRLIGIDAPEDGECWSAEAANTLRRLLGDAVVLDVDQSDRDQFGRLLRFVSSAGTDVNVEMVRQGAAIARPYPPDTSREDELEQAQREAQRAEVGLWSPTACGPSETSLLAITAINADPPGDDTAGPNGEYVDITNRGDDTIDLSGWIVRDDSASHRFTFPDDFELAPGATVRLHTGCGTPTDTALYWCMPASTVWNNDGDTVFIQDPNGNIVTSRSY